MEQPFESVGWDCTLVISKVLKTIKKIIKKMYTIKKIIKKKFSKTIKNII